jgi:hypothetical protein
VQQPGFVCPCHHGIVRPRVGLHIWTQIANKQTRTAIVGIGTGYGLGDWMIGVRFLMGRRIFLSTTASRPALEPTQPPIQWVQGVFLWGLNARVVKLTTHIHLVPRSKNAWSYTSTPPIRLHELLLSEVQGQLYLLLDAESRQRVVLLTVKSSLLWNVTQGFEIGGLLWTR